MHNNKDHFTLTLAGFNKIFPFFILIDKSLSIIDCGISLKKIFPDTLEKSFHSCFTFYRPQPDKLDFDSISLLCSEMLILQTVNHHKLKFRGQLELVNDNENLLFVGAPWFDSTEEFNTSGLKVKDYAPHNPLIDLLHILKTKEIANEELKELLHSLSLQKNELLHANEEIKKIKTALEESNQRYEFVNKATSEAIIDWDIQTGEVHFGDAFQKLFGYKIKSSKEHISNFEEKIHPDDLERIQNSIIETIDSARTHWTQEYRYLKSNGTYAFVSDNAFIIRDNEGKALRMVGAIRDVTEKKIAEQEMASQKKFNEDILNNIPTDIAVFAPNHNYLFVNPHGIKNDEIREWIINKNDFDYTKMRGIDDTNARRRWDLFEEAVETKEKVVWIDEHPTKEGSVNYILRHFYPYFEKNKLKFVIGYGLDITDRKKIEIQLSAALDSVKKNNNELEQFAYVASHDLQEPLRMVTSFLTQLEKKYGPALDEKAKEYIYFAVDGAKRMRQIILDLLEYSRVGKAEENEKEVNINELIKEIEILHSKQIEELHAEIVYHNLPTITSHKTPMRQVFQNLISNSLKYNKAGTPPHITIQTIEKGDFWEFSISDNGIGINEQFFDKIFIIFQRLHNREEFNGTGIGLALTKKILENMGGDIWVTSKENEGSTFYFTIPKKQPPIL